VNIGTGISKKKLSDMLTVKGITNVIFHLLATWRQKKISTRGIEVTVHWISSPHGPFIADGHFTRVETVFMEKF